MSEHVVVKSLLLNCSKFWGLIWVTSLILRLGIINIFCLSCLNIFLPVTVYVTGHCRYAAVDCANWLSDLQFFLFRIEHSRSNPERPRHVVMSYSQDIFVLSRFLVPSTCSVITDVSAVSFLFFFNLHCSLLLDQVYMWFSNWYWPSCTHQCLWLVIEFANVSWYTYFQMLGYVYLHGLYLAGDSSLCRIRIVRVIWSLQQVLRRCSIEEILCIEFYCMLKDYNFQVCTLTP